jgi:hypothetical protein
MNHNNHSSDYYSSDFYDGHDSDNGEEKSVKSNESKIS